jgi:protocatechuate 3,4-dioxygenase beta subunit
MRKRLLTSLFVAMLAVGCVAPSAQPTPEPSPLALGSDATPETPEASATAAVIAEGNAPRPGPEATPAVEARATAAPVTDPSPAASGGAEATATTEAPPVAEPASAEVVPAPSADCTPGALTPAQTEGPYYSQNPPENADLFEEGMAGTRVIVTGYVFDQACDPIPGARVDFWQADAAGQYDNQGYTLRGYQLTNAEGRYTLTTVIPGEYPGRPPHIHVKVTPPGGRTLTSQLYFPDAAGNTADRFFDPGLVVTMEEGSSGGVGFFNFVVANGG